MKKRNIIKVGKVIIPALSAGLTISMLQNQGLGEELTDIILHHQEHPAEGPSYPDYLGLMREKTTPVATGISGRLTFGGDDSDLQTY